MTSKCCSLFCREGLAIDDYEIILDVLSGNRNAYAELVRKYESRVRAYCSASLGGSSQAEDAAQEVFVKAYLALGSFKGNSSFSTWIYRIAVNHCTDILRKTIKRKTESLDALLEQEGTHIESLLSASSETPGTQQEISETIKRLLARLPEKSREVLILREINELSYEEIAETLKCSLDAVKSRLKRARQELAGILRHFLKADIV